MMKGYRGGAMVYLIGGSSHVGKTLLAQKLMESSGYPYTSLDHLKMGFIRSGMTELTVEDDFAMRYWMWPFVTGMIKTVIENGQNIIFEGCYIPAEWQDSFSEEERSHIKCLFIVMSEAYIRDHITDIVDYANVIEKRLEDEVDVERLVRCSEGFKKECEEYGVPYYIIDGEFCLDDILNTVMKL
jgi:2-phosphoglycerate kinase